MYKKTAASCWTMAVGQKNQRETATAAGMNKNSPSPMEDLGFLFRCLW